MTGTAGNDTLNGTNGADVNCGLGGNDTLNGANSNDTIYAGSGNDTVDGGNLVMCGRSIFSLTRSPTVTCSSC
jgi:Ca2+-binding RTX toxin-like protein